MCPGEQEKAGVLSAFGIQDKCWSSERVDLSSA
jgi:hypothetical protein